MRARSLHSGRFASHWPFTLQGTCLPVGIGRRAPDPFTGIARYFTTRYRQPSTSTDADDFSCALGAVAKWSCFLALVVEHRAWLCLGPLTVAAPCPRRLGHTQFASVLRTFDGCRPHRCRNGSARVTSWSARCSSPRAWSDRLDRYGGLVSVSGAAARMPPTGDSMAPLELRGLLSGRSIHATGTAHLACSLVAHSFHIH